MDIQPSGTAARTDADRRTEIDRLIALMEGPAPVVLSPGHVMTDDARRTIENVLSALATYLVDDLDVDSLEDFIDAIEPLRRMGIDFDLPTQSFEYHWTATFGGSITVEVPIGVDRDAIEEALSETIGENIECDFSWIYTADRSLDVSVGRVEVDSVEVEEQ